MKVILSQDGWSNIHQEPIIATGLHYPGKTVFHDACDIGSAEKNAEFCFDLAKSSILKGSLVLILQGNGVRDGRRKYTVSPL